MLDDTLGFGIVTFAEVVVPNAALRVNEVMRGPIPVVEGSPDGVVIVDGHGVIDFQIRPPFTKDRSARAKTNGSTGRMHGLRMVRAPPR